MRKKSSKKVLIIGFLAGLILPFFGLFLGLQVSVVLGNLFTFPWILISILMDQPFGMWSIGLRIVGLIFSGVVWSLILFGITYLYSLIKKSNGKNV